MNLSNRILFTALEGVSISETGIPIVAIAEISVFIISKAITMMEPGVKHEKFIKEGEIENRIYEISKNEIYDESTGALRATYWNFSRRIIGDGESYFYITDWICDNGQEPVYNKEIGLWKIEWTEPDGQKVCVTAPKCSVIRTTYDIEAEGRKDIEVFKKVFPEIEIPKLQRKPNTKPLKKEV